MEQYRTVREVAAALSCSEDTVRRLVTQGRLPALRLGRELRIAEKQVELRLSHSAADGMSGRNSAKKR